jgi:purine-cytosine permease-like protein
MPSKFTKKCFALALSAMMLTGCAATSVTEASSRHNRSYYEEDSHSQGEVNTAAIVGAVVGAVIAKVT